VPAVCAAAPLSAVVTAGMVVVAPRCRSMRADFAAASRFGRDTARNRRAENEDRGGRAEGAGCGDGRPVTLAETVTVVPGVRVVAIAGPAGVDSLTVT